MYDRKTWIVVIVCSILLAFNIHLSQKNASAVAEERKREAAEAQAAKAAEEALNPPPAPVGETTGTLVPSDLPERPAEEIIDLETEEALFRFTSYGGGLKYAEIKNQKHGLEGAVQLNRHGSSPVGAIANNPESVEADPYEYVASLSEPGKRVVFRAKLRSGLQATKTWSLVESEIPGAPYRLDYKLDLLNETQEPVNLGQFSVFLGTATPLDHVENAAQSGFVWHNEGSFDFTATTSFSGGWFRKERSTIHESLERAEFAGVTNQFFATVLKPREPTAASLWTKANDEVLKEGERPVKSVRGGLQLPAITLSPGEGRGISYEVFAGPKENRMLRKMGDDWGTLMNYGFFSPFSRFMNWSLWWVHAGMEKISGKWSWGLAVVVLTVLLRTVIWPLYNRSNRTMKRMSKLKPEMDKLKEKYPDDPQKMNTEMMGLYRKYGINPLGGCLPMFAQLPIFFGFYSMLLHAVEMRGQTFLWVNDLSQPDTIAHIAGIPINPLPIVMAISSFAQMAMMPKTGGDKTQMMILKLMPFFFLFICYNFASALSLYWTVSNVFSIGQTWLSNRMPEPELKANPKAGKKSFVERMAEKQADMEKMRQARGRVVDSSTESSKKRPPRTGG